MNEHALVEAAFDYLRRGLSVIALTGKAPNGAVHRRGLYDAFRVMPQTTTNEAILRAAFEHPRTTGIGIVITFPYFVVDIDGEEGARNWLALVGEESFLPDRWVAKTGRGLHLWYARTGPTPSMRIADLLDLKGQGGYVAAPPSLHPDGHRYEWLLEPTDDLAAPLEPPDALQSLIEQHNFDRSRALATKQMSRRVRHQPFEDGRLWASFGFDHLYERMRDEPKGNRNNFLHWAAATMAEEGATDEEFDLLLAEATDLGEAGRRTVRSARRHVSGA